MQHLLLQLAVFFGAHLSGPEPSVCEPPEPAASAPVPGLTAVLIDQGAALGTINVSAAPHPVLSATLTNLVGTNVGSVSFQMLPGLPAATWGPVAGTVNYTPLGMSTTFTIARWFNTDGTLGAVGQTGILFAYPVYEPYPPLDVGDNIVRIRIEWKVPSGGLAGGPWSHVEIQ